MDCICTVQITTSCIRATAHSRQSSEGSMRGLSAVKACLVAGCLQLLGKPSVALAPVPQPDAASHNHADKRDSTDVCTQPAHFTFNNFPTGSIRWPIAQCVLLPRRPSRMQVDLWIHVSVVQYGPSQEKSKCTCNPTALRLEVILKQAGAPTYEPPGWSLAPTSTSSRSPGSGTSGPSRRRGYGRPPAARHRASQQLFCAKRWLLAAAKERHY